jgi:predicted DNA binding CopG/RHH family protein
MKEKRKSKPFPKLNSDKEATDFVAEADLTEYDFSKFESMKFEFNSKSSRINMRVPDSLLESIKEIAQKKNIPYTRFIRQVLESVIAKETKRV